MDRAEVQRILEQSVRDPEYKKWEVQGFGMLRTYLPGADEPRLQVWDQRLACWGNNAIHDHPWRFESIIYAGMLFNTRYDKPGNPWEWDYATEFCSTEIIPGTRGGQLTESPVQKIQLTESAPEIYSVGDCYRQHHRELHLTRYLQGTVTLIRRFDRETADRAVVAWRGEAKDQPPFVNPRPATNEEVIRTVTTSLEAWF